MKYTNPVSIRDRIRFGLPGLIPNPDIAHAIQISTGLFDAARKEVRILTQRLDPAAYGSTEMLHARDSFLNADPRRRVRILVADRVAFEAVPVHRFLSGTKFASQIEVRFLRDDYRDVVHSNFSVTDGAEYRYERNLEAMTGYGAVQDPDFAAELRQLFDELWEDALSQESRMEVRAVPAAT